MGERQDPSDAQLLRACAESGQETAFCEIVTRHRGLAWQFTERLSLTRTLSRWERVQQSRVLIFAMAGV